MRVYEIRNMHYTLLAKVEAVSQYRAWITAMVELKYPEPHSIRISTLIDAGLEIKEV